MTARGLPSKAADPVETMPARRAFRRPQALLLVILLSAAPAKLAGKDFFLSPSGNDRQSGTDADHAWRTFARATRPTVLTPGNRLILLDGEYTVPESGRLRIDCSSGGNASNGTAEAHVTVMARNERRAWIHGDGGADTVRLYECSYYDIVGLNVSMSDRPVKTSFHALEVEGAPRNSSSTHITLRRNLFHHDNRYANSHLVAISRSTYWLTEDNEYYYFHRHAEWHGAGADYGISRRNYANSRAYEDLPGCGSYPAPNCSGGKGGDESFSNYPGSHNTYENDISEGSQDGFTVNASGPSSDNHYFGNVSLNDVQSWRIVARGDGLGQMPVGTEIRDAVMIPTGNWPAAWISSSKNTVFDHVSVFLSTPKQSGFGEDSQQTKGDGNRSILVRNSFITGTAHRGIHVEDPPERGTSVSWTVSHVWVRGAREPFVPAEGGRNGRLSDVATSDPGVGSCRLWCPDGAPCKGRGSDGADLGARILYRYENGRLTKKRLWDPDTGAFLSAGGIVQGINDVPGSSLRDLQERLNVNRNGCRFPSDYGEPAENRSAPPVPPTPETRGP